jgi:hypothetical protein
LVLGIPPFVASWLFERSRAATMWTMKENTILIVTCLLSILLATLHVTDDIVRGMSKAEPSNIALVVLVVFLYGTLLLAGRRSGYVITLLVGLFAAASPNVLRAINPRHNPTQDTLNRLLKPFTLRLSLAPLTVKPRRTAA